MRVEWEATGDYDEVGGREAAQEALRLILAQVPREHLRRLTVIVVADRDPRGVALGIYQQDSAGTAAIHLYLQPHLEQAQRVPKAAWAVVQVKGGKVQVGLVRDFAHVVVREKASLGFFIYMGDQNSPVTGPMRKEAIKEGYWTSAGGNAYPKLQILTVQGLLNRMESSRIPPQDKRYLFGYKAKRQNQLGNQGELFGND